MDGFTESLVTDFDLLLLPEHPVSKKIINPENRIGEKRVLMDKNLKSEQT
jgi:hypothetical protein